MTTLIMKKKTCINISKEPISRMRPKQDTPDSLLTCSRNGILETPLEIIIF